MIRICRWLYRVRAHVAEAAAHADPVRAHQILAVVVRRIVIVTHGVPSTRRFLIEVGIGEHSESYDASRIAVERTRWNVLSTRADLHARIFRFVFERIGRTI